FAGSICYMEYKKYVAGGTCIQLYDEEDGCPVATATVHLEGIPDDHVAIKNYSENKGILHVLVDAHIVSPPVSYHESGYVSIPICKLLRIERDM
ncbi:MAG: hypothetical protein WCJ57_04815, partial [Candidatus Falkowbacteria bacterium]